MFVNANYKILAGVQFTAFSLCLLCDTCNSLLCAISRQNPRPFLQIVMMPAEHSVLFFSMFSMICLGSKKNKKSSTVKYAEQVRCKYFVPPLGII